MPAEKSGEYFDRLRKEYHKRREFQSIEVQLAEPDKELEEMIVKLGFKEKWGQSLFFE